MHVFYGDVSQCEMCIYVMLTQTSVVTFLIYLKHSSDVDYSETAEEA